MQTGEKERDERSFRHREVPRVESRSVSVLTRRDRNQRVRVTAAGQGSGGDAVDDRSTGQRRAARFARGKREGAGPSGGFKRKDGRGGQSIGRFGRLQPLPVRATRLRVAAALPYGGRMKTFVRCKPLPAVAAAHLHGHCYYRRPPQSAVTCRFCALCGGLCRHSHRRSVARRRRRRDRRETRKKCGFKNLKEKNNKKVLTNHYK